jgi:hypothetical protein
MQNIEACLAPSLAAQHLATQLGRTPELWLYRLANWRRPGRRSVIAFEVNEAGNPTYSHAALNAFIDDQVGKQAFLAESRVAADVQAGAKPELEGTERPHVRVSFVIGGATQSVFAIDVTTARKLAESLVKSAALVDRVTASHEIKAQ